MQQHAGVTVMSCTTDVLSALCLGSPEVHSQAASIYGPEHSFDVLLEKRGQEGTSGGFAYTCDRMQDLPLVLVVSRETSLFLTPASVERWHAEKCGGFSGDCVT